MAANEEETKRFQGAIEDAERNGVNPTTMVWPVLGWKSGHDEIIQIARNAAYCQACGSFMVAPHGAWKPSFRCAICYEAASDDECCHCGEDLSEGPAWPEPWPRKMCDSCWQGLVPRD